MDEGDCRESKLTPSVILLCTKLDPGGIEETVDAHGRWNAFAPDRGELLFKKYKVGEDGDGWEEV